MLITFLAIDGGVTDSLVTYQYDSVADTFSAILDTFPTTTNFASNQNCFPLVRRSDGTMVAIFDVRTGPTTNELKYLIISAAGLITSSGVIEAGVPNTGWIVESAVVDSSDIVHVLYIESAVTDTLRHVTLSALNVVGVPQAIDTLNGVLPYEFGAAVLWEGGDSIVLPRTNNDPGLIYVGTPVSNPVWQTVQVHTFDPSIQDEDCICVCAAGSVVKVFYIRGDGSTILQAMVAEWNGVSMGAPSVYWDIGTNPPVGMIGKTITQMGTPLSITAFQNSSTLGVAVSLRTSLGPTVVGTVFVPTTPPGLFVASPVTLPNAPVIYNVTFVGGPWGPFYDGASTIILSGVDETGAPSVAARSLDSGATWTTLGGPAPAPGHGFTTMAGISDGAPQPPLTVQCDNPPVGIVATFYVHTFPVASGTPPYTFEITAGTLPDGLTLDVNTGEVSGTPLVNGRFPFTIQATDSDDVSGSVDCSITIRKRCMLVDVN